jgi:hypothetical protein
MRIEVEVTGTTALICNRFHDEAAEAATNGRRASAAAGDRGTPMEQAEKKLYTGKDDETLIIPQPNLLRCIVDGGLYHKAGKSKITTQRNSLLYACLDIEGAEIEIHHKEPWRVDTRAVRIPSTGGRILAYRPMFDDWSLQFVAVLDTDVVGVKLLRMIVDDAGKKVGLGDFRPATKGPFGKFVVTQWKELPEAALRVASKKAA